MITFISKIDKMHNYWKLYNTKTNILFTKILFQNVVITLAVAMFKIHIWHNFVIRNSKTQVQFGRIRVLTTEYSIWIVILQVIYLLLIDMIFTWSEISLVFKPCLNRSRWSSLGHQYGRVTNERSFKEHVR